MFSIFYFLFTELSRAKIATESLFCPHCTAMWVMSMSHGIPLIRRPSPQFLKGVHIKIILLPVRHILHHWLWFIGPSSGDTPKSLHQKRATAAISIIFGKFLVRNLHRKILHSIRQRVGNISSLSCDPCVFITYKSFKIIQKQLSNTNYNATKN